MFANVGPTQFFAEPEYAALCEFADHHRHLHEMVLADTLPLDVEPMVKIVARHAEVPSADLYRPAVAAGIEGVELTHSGAPYMEMAAAGVSKASALAQLCAIDGIDASEVAAAGDAFNDVAMLTWAGTLWRPPTPEPRSSSSPTEFCPRTTRTGWRATSKSWLRGASSAADGLGSGADTDSAVRHEFGEDAVEAIRVVKVREMSGALEDLHPPQR